MAIRSDPADNLEIPRLAQVIGRVRTAHLRVHCITSPVAAERTANTLLALGVCPSLTVDREDVQDFTKSADALLVNLGMMDTERRVAIPLAVKAAREAGKRWVLDPVLTNVSGPRSDFARALLSAAPAAVKANAAEAALLAVAPAETVRIVTGAIDRITFAGKTAELPYGTPLATQVTAMGCALGAVIAACLAVEEDPFIASAAALLAYGLAGQQAAHTASGPGSFGVALYDHLAALTPEMILRNAAPQ